MLIYVTIYQWGQSDNMDHVKLGDKLSKEETSSTPKLPVILRRVFQKIIKDVQLQKVHLHIILWTFFFRLFFLSRLHAQHGVWTHNPEIKGCMLYQLRHSCTPSFNLEQSPFKLILLIFTSKFSCTHIKSGMAAIHILALLAENF